MARRLGIDEVAAQVLPADKADAVAEFQAGGRRVAMVGDGVNDAPPWPRRTWASPSAPARTWRSSRRASCWCAAIRATWSGAITLSRASYRKMRQNLAWATGYNVVAIPVAMGLLVPWGIDLPMAVGAVAMSVSTIIVAANAQLLRRVRLRPREHGGLKPNSSRRSATG